MVLLTTRYTMFIEMMTVLLAGAEVHRSLAYGGDALSAVLTADIEVLSCLCKWQGDFRSCRDVLLVENFDLLRLMFERLHDACGSMVARSC
jgi:hypothetical protein